MNCFPCIAAAVDCNRKLALKCGDVFLWLMLTIVWLHPRIYGVNRGVGGGYSGEELLRVGPVVRLLQLLAQHDDLIAAEPGELKRRTAGGQFGDVLPKELGEKASMIMCTRQ